MTRVPSTPGPCRLHSLNTSVDRRDIHFSFASGRLTYDCVTCGAKCCRGFRYLISPHDIKAHTGVRPALALFLRERAGTWPQAYKVVNHAPACFFLNDKNQCDLHGDPSSSSKPETCRLFPFNSYSLIGRRLVVGPHLSLCPLQITSDDRRSDASSHDLLFEEMARAGIWSPIPVRPLGEDSELLLDVETQIVDTSERHLKDADYLPFAMDQVACASPSRRTGRSEGLGRLEEYRQLVSDIIGLPALPSHLLDADVIRVLIATSGVLRAYSLFRRRDHHTGLRDVQERLPHALVAFHVIVAAAKDAGMRETTLQTITSLFLDSLDLVELLSCADLVMAINTTKPFPLMLGTSRTRQIKYIDMLRGLLDARTERRPSRLGDLLVAALAECESPVERIQFLRAIATRLSGHLVFAGPHATPRRQLRRVFQEWAVQHISPETLAVVAERNSVRRAET